MTFQSSKRWLIDRWRFDHVKDDLLTDDVSINWHFDQVTNERWRFDQLTF